MNLNKVILIGRLTRDPEMRSTTSGQSVASFGLATNRNWTDSSGQKQEVTDFHNIVAWRRLAEICAQYLKKGSLIMIEGRIQTRSWQGQDGNTRYTTEIVAENMQMGPRAQGQSDSFTPQNDRPAAPENSTADLAGTPTIQLDEQGEPIGEKEVDNPGEPPETVMPF